MPGREPVGPDGIKSWCIRHVFIRFGECKLSAVGTSCFVRSLDLIEKNPSFIQAAELSSGC